jgi:hypothetical protein
MKFSIVILCWNNREVIEGCLRSIYAGTDPTRFEVVVSDNGSTDGSIEFIRQEYPAVTLIENGRNLGFGKGNNVAINACRGELIALLNQDTIVHDGALDKWVSFADNHPEAGAFGCMVLNPDGSNQGCARPFPTLWGEWIAAFYLRALGRFSDLFESDTYLRWKGDTERAIDTQAGCALLVRADLLRKLGGFDEQFYFYWEDVDLCHRIWDSGFPILYTPDVLITHIGGQSTKNAPEAFLIERYRNRYRYFYKYFGKRGSRRCRRVVLASLITRYVGYKLVDIVMPLRQRRETLRMLRAAIAWNFRVDPVRFVEHGQDPLATLDTAT